MAREKNPGGINTGNVLEHTCIPAKPIALEYLYVTKKMGTPEIADHLNVSTFTVRACLQLIGVPIRSKQEAPRIAFARGIRDVEEWRTASQRGLAKSRAVGSTQAKRDSARLASAIAVRKRTSANVLRICLTCGAEFYRRPCEIKRGRTLDYCNAKCGRKRNFAVKERQGSAKLTEWEVYEIRERYARGGVSQHDLAKQFSISRSSIGEIVTGRRWNSLTIPSTTPEELSPSVVRRNAELAAYLGITPEQLNSQV